MTGRVAAVRSDIYLTIHYNNVILCGEHKSNININSQQRTYMTRYLGIKIQRREDLVDFSVVVAIISKVRRGGKT